MKQKKWSVTQARDIINNEGIGYAVQSYCSGSDFEDKKLVKLWNTAKKALDALEEYVENNADDEYFDADYQDE